MKTFNYAIDLGTTNSLIAKYENGSVEVFKNPYGLKENLPSVVGYRGDRILIGDKAKEYLEKDPENVFACFKRKMGTVDSYWVPNLSKTITPIELSAVVLKELKNFVRTDEPLESIVITIPASFDTIQSNATKKAGYEAGFKEVALLQEPIAACLAAANKTDIPVGKKWLVYDFGGGTFDVAIVENNETELKVVDHKGDNFLGGMDFDRGLVEKVILPHLYQKGSFNKLQEGEKSLSNEFQKLFFVLANKAEEVKKELSAAQEAFLDFEVEDDNGNEVDISMTITRGELNEVIFTKVMRSIDLVRELLEVNHLTKNDIDRLVLVGGTTYIPLVKEMLTQHLDIPLDTSIDPTSAIAVGGAYYAGNKIKELKSEYKAEVNTSTKKSGLSLKTSYLKSTRELEEMVIGIFDGVDGELFFRIHREDKGYDSGLKPIRDARFTELLRLTPKMVNRFYISVFDSNNQLIDDSFDPIEISHGTFNVTGQPLPNDICIEVDDLVNNRTKLDVLFEKNSILPLKKKIYKEISRTIFKSGTENLIINILEGDRFASPSTNQVIGCVEIKAEDLNSDLVRGSDVEISLEVSESRDITVKAFLSMNDQEFENVFSPSEKYVSIGKLQDELSFLLHNIKKDIEHFQKKEEYEIAQELESMRMQALEIKTVLSELHEEDKSDLRYQLEERKRSIAQKYDTLEKNKKLTHVISEYFRAKDWVEYELEDDSLDNRYKNKYDIIIKDEANFIKERSILLIESKTQDLWDLRYSIVKQKPTYWIDRYYDMQSKRITDFTDENQAKRLLDNGQDALTRQNYKELEVIVKGLWSLLPRDESKEMKIKGTGLM